MRILRCAALMTICVLWLSWSNAAAAVPYAAQVFISAETVSLTRSGTVKPLPLRRDAIALIGEGDTLVTGPRGRARIVIDESTQILVISDTRLNILAFSDEGGRVDIRVQVDGHIIYDSAAESDHRLILETPFMQVSVRGSAGIWTGFEHSDVVTVARGTSDVTTASGETFALAAGDGLLHSGSIAEVTALGESAPFLHAAQVVGKLRGCPATVSRTGGTLNVRAAPGLTGTLIGYIPEGSPVYAFAVSASRRWWRIQRFSGFGWVLGAYLEGDCSGLPVEANPDPTRNREFYELLPEEYALLIPYYGSSETNAWVYRSFRESPFAES